MSSTLIKDKATRDSVQSLEKKARALEQIKQLPHSASLQNVIDTINKITNSMKRR